ncbi:MAG: hypothetical protein LUG95_01160 [Clostridiales bacterium]|nr:hypothetical protein [Clostridiales bacterium]
MRSKSKNAPSPLSNAIKAKNHRSKKKKGSVKKLNINYKKLLKYSVIAVTVIVVITTSGFGINYAVEQSKIAYLKPYQNKYPDVEFPTGIMEKYCDTYGENPNSVGYIYIDETGLSSPVLDEENDTYPYAEANNAGSEQFNFVVYLNDSSLEAYYSSAEAYNSDATTGFMTYSDLYNDYRFKIIGAFYTNTVAADDDGYIFPYNVTEKMTADSYSSFFDRLETRFIYSTGIALTKQDTLLTISCPTDYRENFRFVVVGVLRNDSTDKATAEEKSQIRYPQIIYDENGELNPYCFASNWYPEIIVTVGDSETTETQSIIDYE